MLYKYGILCGVGVLLFCGGYLIGDNKTKSIEKKLMTEYSETIKTNLEEYNKTIERYKAQIVWLQQNNITTVKTVYLPSGKKIVTKTVDRSIIKNNEVTNYVKTQDSKITANSTNIVKSSISEETKRPVLSQYKLGVISPVNDFKNINVTGGIRLASLPIFINIQTPTSSDFYKKISIGAEFEF